MSFSQKTLCVPVGPASPSKKGVLSCWRKSISAFFRSCSLSMKGKALFSRVSTKNSEIHVVESPFTGTTLVEDGSFDSTYTTDEESDESDEESYSESNESDDEDVKEKTLCGEHLKVNENVSTLTCSEYTHKEDVLFTESTSNEVTIWVSSPELVHPVPRALQSTSTIPSNEWTFTEPTKPASFVPRLPPIFEDIEEELTHLDWPVTKISTPPAFEDAFCSQQPAFRHPRSSVNSFDILAWSATPQTHTYVRLAEATIDKHAELTILTKRTTVPEPALGPDSRRQYDALRYQATQSMLTSRDEIIYKKTSDVDHFSDLVDMRLAEESDDRAKGFSDVYLQMTLTLDKYKTLLTRVLAEYKACIKRAFELGITIKCARLNISQLEHRQSYLVALTQTGPGPYPRLEGGDSLRRMALRRSLVLSAATYGGPLLQDYRGKCEVMEKQFYWYTNRAADCAKFLDKVIKCGIDVLCEDVYVE